MRKRRCAHSFQNACAVCNLKGVLRLVVPDVGEYLRAYSGPWEVLADMRPLDRTADGWRDRWKRQEKFHQPIGRSTAEH